MTTENPQELPFEEKMLQELISMGINESDGKRVLKAIGYAEEGMKNYPWNNTVKRDFALIAAKVIKIPEYRTTLVAQIRDDLKLTDGDFLHEPFQAISVQFGLAPQHTRRLVNTAFTSMVESLQGKTFSRSTVSRLGIETRGNTVGPSAGNPSRGGFKF